MVLSADRGSISRETKIRCNQPPEHPPARVFLPAGRMLDFARAEDVFLNFRRGRCRRRAGLIDFALYFVAGLSPARISNATALTASAANSSDTLLPRALMFGSVMVVGIVHRFSTARRFHEPLNSARGREFDRMRSGYRWSWVGSSGDIWNGGKGGYSDAIMSGKRHIPASQDRA